MQYTLPVAVIILLLLMICVHAHFIRRIESFGVNAGYYLSGDGGWAGQMQPAALSADGDTGLVPAPKAGQQNSYLRGDGKWIQANNAPTAAVFLHMAYFAANDIDIPTTTYPAFPFNKVLENSGGGFITPTGTPTTKFILAAGCTYKCTASMGYAKTGTDFAYQWLNNKTNTAFGVPGLLYTLAPRNMLAVGYITTTTPVPISLNVNYNNGGGTIINTAGYGQYPWCTIEVVSNNNTISPFTGSTASADGFVGYIPTPLAGQQNYILTGDGKWTGPQYYYSISGTQATDKDPYLVKWPLTGNVFSKTTTAITHTVETTFTLAPGYAYKIIAGVGSSNARGTGGCLFYILANKVQIGNTGTMISTTNPDAWATSPTCMAYHEPVVPTDISFAVSRNGSGQLIGSAWDDPRASAWISIEMLH